MKNALILLTILMLVGGFFAFKPAPHAINYEYSQMTTIESVVPGGLGRSRMLINEKGGNKDEIDMKNFFSLGGINFGNINTNEQLILEKLSQMNANGWELYNITPGVVSPSANSTGIFITRYLFRKEK